MTRFRIRYTIDVTLDASEIWPDGDMPEKNRAAAVEKALNGHSGRLHRNLEDWGLFGELEVDEVS
jgi:hypothetical protein